MGHRFLDSILPWRRAANAGSRTLRLGARGERIAAKHLKSTGLRILARNLRLAEGEIDLLAETKDRSTLVVVEVKTRAVEADDPQRLPERAITSAKGRKLAQLARAVRGSRHSAGRRVRIDVVAVEIRDGGPPEVRHYPNAIDGAGRRV